MVLSRAARPSMLVGLVAGIMFCGGGKAMACNPGGNFVGPGTFAGLNNLGTRDCVSVTNGAVVTGNIVNGGSGVIGPPPPGAPAAVSVVNSTVNGSIENQGIINSGASGVGIGATGSSSISGVTNAGTINAANPTGPAMGINLNLPSASGGVTNSGTITATSGGGSAAGISVGGGPTGPSSITSTTGGPSSPSGGGTTTGGIGGRPRHR